MASHDNQTSTDLVSLQTQIEAKQRDVGTKMSALKQELTRNPMAEFAEQKPLVAIGVAAMLGLAAALVLRGRGVVRSRERERKQMISAIAGYLQEEKKEGQTLTEGDIRRIVETSDLARPVSQPVGPSSRVWAVISPVLGAVGKSVFREVLNTVLNSFSERTSAAKEPPQKEAE